MTKIFGWRARVLLVFAVTPVAGASAQSAPVEQRAPAEQYIDTTAGLTLEDAIAGALEREPSYRASRADLDVAHGVRRQAALRSNPTLTLEGRKEPGGTDTQTMVQGSVPLELFRRSARVDVAQRELEVAEHAVADRIRLLVNDIKMRYGQAAAAARDVKVADDLALSARRDLELLRRRVDEGESPPLDRDRLDVDVRRLEAARLQAAGRAEVAMVALKRSVGLPADASIKLRDTLETLAGLSRSGQTRDARERPDVRQADAQVQLETARIGQARADGRFDLSLFGSYVRMDAGFPQRGFGAGGDLERVHSLFHYASGGAMILLPLWNRNQGAIAAARAGQSAASARLDAALLAAQAEVAAATAQAVQTSLALAIMADGVVLARQNVEVVRQTYELGRATLPEVLAEQRRYLEFENEYTSALRDAFEARASLEFARGELK